MNDALAAVRGILKKYSNIGITATEVIRFDANDVIDARRDHVGNL